MESFRAWTQSAIVDADWLTPERALAFARVSLAAMVAAAAVWLAFSHGGLDPNGKPIGTDFLSFWTASRLALDGRPELAWDAAAQYAAERSLFGPSIVYARFLYPPTFLLICLPLALLPYLVSLVAWLAATFYGFYRAALLYMPDVRLVGLLAFPAVLINCGHGQNGFLSAALLGGGLGLMNRRPALAGLLMGGMAFKPHLALALPFALIFTGRWTTLICAAGAALAFSALSRLAFGDAAWAGFVFDLARAQSDMENNFHVNQQMQSVFSAVRLLHGSLPLAYASQALFAAGAIGALYILGRYASRRSAEAPAAICACLMSSPYLFDYDLPVLAFPLLWLVASGRRDGFMPVEKAILVLAFLLPLMSRVTAVMAGWPLAPPVVLAVFALVVRRASLPGAGLESSASAA